MCRWIAYRGEPIFLEELILTPCNSLIHQSLHCLEGATPTNGDGFGVGWFGARREPGLYREVLPAWNDFNLKNLSRHLQSHLFFAHVRASTGMATTRVNCHPFAFEQWLFMHNGQIGDYDRMRRVIEAKLDDRHYAARLGTTDSELIFLLMAQNGLDADPAGAIATTIHDISATAQRHGAAEPFKLTMCLSDGQRLFACRYASDGTPPSLYWSDTAKGTLVASEPLDGERSHWHPVQPDTLLIVDASGVDAVALFAASDPAASAA